MAVRFLADTQERQPHSGNEKGSRIWGMGEAGCWKSTFPATRLAHGLQIGNLPINLRFARLT
jgi:hypothetical protein